jgi:hypothetical protein
LFNLFKIVDKKASASLSTLTNSDDENTAVCRLEAAQLYYANWQKILVMTGIKSAIVEQTMAPYGPKPMGMKAGFPVGSHMMTVGF